MAFAGLLLVVLGIGGLISPRVVTIGPERIGYVTGGSWTAIAVGVLVMLSAMARILGRGIYPLAIGVGALIAQLTHHWMNNGRVHGLQPWVNIGLLLLIAGGALAVIIELAWDAVEAAGGLAVFAIVSAGSDIAYDFGHGWDELMNVGTAVFTAGFVIAVVVALTDEPRTESKSGVISADLGRLMAAGFGLTGALITVMASFPLPVGLEVLLFTPLAVLGFWAAAPWVAYSVVAAGVERRQLAQADIGAAPDDGGLPAKAGGFLWFGYLALLLPVEVVVFSPPWVLVAALVVLAVGAGALAVRWWIIGYPVAVRRLAHDEVVDVEPVSGVAEALEQLAAQDAVYRLLPFNRQFSEPAFDRFD